MLIIDRDTYEKRFFITVHDAYDLSHDDHQSRTVRLQQLLEVEGAEQFVQLYAPLIKALIPGVAATYFASYFSRVCAAFHYGLWHDGVLLDLTLPNVRLHLVQENTSTKLRFQLMELQGQEIPDTGRESFVREQMEQFYGAYVRPLFESVAAAAGIKPSMLWGQLANVMHYTLDTWNQEAETPQQVNRLAYDRDLLLHHLRPETFGTVSNPLDVPSRFVESHKQPGTMLRMKSSCCLAYQTETNGYCYTCPRMKEEERERIRNQFLSSIVPS